LPSDEALLSPSVTFLRERGVRMVVERSMYWDSGGVLFKGGANATGVRLP
jgi:hypothetical protein